MSEADWPPKQMSFMLSIPSWHFVPCDRSKLPKFGPWHKVKGQEKWSCTIPPEFLPLAIEAGVDIHWRFEQGEEDE